MLLSAGPARNELWYTIPYHLQPNNTWNMSTEYLLYTNEYAPEKRRLYEEQRGRELCRKEKKRKEGKNKTKTKTNIRPGRRPSPEGEGCCVKFAGDTISPMICPVHGPTEGRHEKTRRKTMQAEGRDRAKIKTFKMSSPMPSWWAKDDTRDQKQGRDEGLKTKAKKRKVTKNSNIPVHTYGPSDDFPLYQLVTYPRFAHF